MTFKRITALALALIICTFLCVFPASANDNAQLTLLFTHDLHSHLLPAANENGEGTYGGYARLMTAIRAQKENGITKKQHGWETLRKEVVSHGFYIQKFFKKYLTSLL